jgi:hypothetical protein
MPDSHLIKISELYESGQICQAPHLLSSPDLAPSVFYLSGTLNERLAKCHGTTKGCVFGNVTEIVESISEEELVQHFLNWRTRLEQVIATGGEYI